MWPCHGTSGRIKTIVLPKQQRHAKEGAQGSKLCILCLRVYGGWPGLRKSEAEVKRALKVSESLTEGVGEVDHGRLSNCLAEMASGDCGGNCRRNLMRNVTLTKRTVSRVLGRRIVGNAFPTRGISRVGGTMNACVTEIPRQTTRGSGSRKGGGSSWDGLPCQTCYNGDVCLANVTCE